MVVRSRLSGAGDDCCTAKTKRTCGAAIPLADNFAALSDRHQHDLTHADAPQGGPARGERAGTVVGSTANGWAGFAAKAS